MTSKVASERTLDDLRDKAGNYVIRDEADAAVLRKAIADAFPDCPFDPPSASARAERITAEDKAEDEAYKTAWEDALDGKKGNPPDDKIDINVRLAWYQGHRGGTIRSNGTHPVDALLEAADIRIAYQGHHLPEQDGWRIIASPETNADILRIGGFAWHIKWQLYATDKIYRTDRTSSAAVKQEIKALRNRIREALKAETTEALTGR